ncbi:MAG: hypothetical protein A3F16_05575 [Deltaproteobacteria bacterium RIFCSPHIGHO2_12_FULL_43_9]|nr:MAG: hypothetical protein A3F16_05575 [Deltaproteobacteria bacterium RIFCSPHIGHO2_12_FULL_43_9]
MKPRILIIDDEKNIVDALKRLFRRDYDVDTALSADDGLALLEKNSYHLVICDQRMPGLTGVQFFARAKEIQPETIRVLLTGYADIQSVIDAINRGEIYRYISKPWDVDEIKALVAQGVETYNLRDSVKKGHLELEAAFAKLKELDEAKTRFFGLVSHELRTPLTTILVYAESLIQGLAQTTAEAKRFYGLIHDAASRLSDIVSDIIDYTNLEALNLKLNIQRIDISAIMTRAILKLKEKINDKKVKIDATLPTISVLADELQLEKVFLKILDNAIEAAGDGGKIEIDVTEEETSVNISIKDSGQGIPKEMLETLFTPFLSKDIMHHHRGLGLSLAICKGIVDLHSGRIWAEKLKKGLDIHISLPAGPTLSL